MQTSHKEAASVQNPKAWVGADAQQSISRGLQDGTERLVERVDTGNWNDRAARTVRKRIIEHVQLDVRASNRHTAMEFAASSERCKARVRRRKA